MKNVKTWKLATLTALLSGSAFAAPLQWECNWPEARAQAFSLYQGETATFEPTFRVNGAIATNVAVEAVYYQTNGMGSAWWRLDGRDFAPSNDCGAASYRFFVAASDPGGKVYRANGTLRMLPSPGFTPNEITPPVVALDFASTAVTNAPYYTKPETDERIVALAPAPGNYAVVSNAAMNAATAYKSLLDCEWLYDGSHVLARTTPEPNAVAEWTHNHSPRWGGETLQYLGCGIWLFRLSSSGIECLATNAEDSVVLDFSSEQLGDFTLARINDVRSPVVYRDDLAAAAEAATNYTDEAIASIDIPEPDLTDYATHAQATNAARAVTAPLEENVGVLWQFVFADSVWLAVTNYMRTVEGVVPSLQLWEVRDGATNLVYHSTEEVSNVVDSAIAALRAEITNAMPDKAWSRYQSATGAENPQPADITIVSTPKIMLTGGGEWNRYVKTGGSAIWVLHTKGSHTIGGGTNGTFFCVEDDEGKAQFEVSRTDSYEIDALADSIGWDGNGNFQVTYNAPSSGNQPVLYASTNLVEAFAAEENGEINSLGVTVNWGSAGGLWRATIVQDATAPALFVHAKVLQEGSVVIRNNAPTTLDGGLFINNTRYRVVPATISGKTVLTLEVAP